MVKITFEVTSYEDLLNQVRRFGALSDCFNRPPLQPSDLPAKTALGTYAKTTANPKLEEAGVEEPQSEAVSPPPASPPPLVDTQSDHSVTLDNVGTVSYEELLDFCFNNPQVGVDVEQSKHSFFRKLVEHKVRSYLTHTTQNS